MSSSHPKEYVKQMTTIIILLVLSLAAVSFLYLRCNSKEINGSSDRQPFLSRQEVEKVVRQLVELGYYKYADPNDIESLKEDLTSSIAQYGILSTIYFEEPITPKDYRYYMFDGEAVFEQGGFYDAIKDMKGLFDKIGLKLEIINQIEDENTLTKGINHELTVNGKRYIVFQNFKGVGWGEAAYKFAEMINDQLQIQNKDERLYLLSAGNEGEAIFLTDKQFELMDKLFTEDKLKPLKPDKWLKVFEIE
jgi:hypothetical protein